MKTHELTHANVESLLSYAPSTGKFFWKSGNEVGSFDKKGYVVIWVLGRCVRAHRLAYFMIHGEWPAEQIDHINGVKSDNRWCNLRPASRKGNQRNQKRSVANTSGVKGVIYDTRRGTWYFQMRRDDGSRYTKSGFLTKGAAAEECRRVREKLHGEFANHG